MPSRMKDLLRRLHIRGSGAATIVQHADLIPTPDLTSSSSSSDREEDGNFNVAAEDDDFQMQMALAISASHESHPRHNHKRGGNNHADSVDSDQMDAAKQMSLGHAAASRSDTKSLLQFQSLRYWNYNVIAYEEKVMDGFYDAYGITSNFIKRGKMPMLVDLQAKLISESGDYEVILVNRTLDLELQKLEKKACALSNECCVSEKGLILSGLLQRLADIVVTRMGGPVGSADKITERWARRSHELQDSLRTIVLPLGCLDAGTSRHRALLFKVLADKINIPCMLVKGSYYTGSDDGALNLIKADNGSEYIIDLMGEPGALIPVEVPSSQLQNYGLSVRSCPSTTHLMLDDETGVLGTSSDLDSVSTGSKSENYSNVGGQISPVENMHAGRNETERFGHNLGSLLQSLHISSERSPHTESSPAEKIRVNNVSKYVLSAAKNPEFAQKLHTVLLESGALPPPDLFSDVHSQDISENKIFGKFVRDTVQADRDRLFVSHEKSLIPFQREHSARRTRLEQGGCDNTRKGSVTVCDSVDELEQSDAMTVDSVLEVGAALNNIEFSKESAIQISEEVDPVLGERKEWEIQWEDLRIGRRIGIGSYGEVYHADCNGSEVAVKKFLDQDLSGDAVAQFKSEVEIMLRLRHPNVVLFMGAITRAPHLSILTEFLPRGSLYGLMRRPNFPLDDRRRLRMAIDVAKGMNYLHTSHPPVVHRDLKSPNLLVDKHWVLKVCDFGLSRIKHHTFLASKSIAGTPEWMAPEVLRNEPANEKCDVFSFGVILWELATTRIPWHGLNPMQVVGAVGFQNRRLEIPENVDPEVAQIIRECWQVEPHLRPSFSQLLSRLGKRSRMLVVKTNSTP